MGNFFEMGFMNLQDLPQPFAVVLLEPLDDMRSQTPVVLTTMLRNYEGSMTIVGVDWTEIPTLLYFSWVSLVKRSLLLLFMVVSWDINWISLLLIFIYWLFIFLILFINIFFCYCILDFVAIFLFWVYLFILLFFIFTLIHLHKQPIIIINICLSNLLIKLWIKWRRCDALVSGVG